MKQSTIFIIGIYTRLLKWNYVVTIFTGSKNGPLLYSSNCDLCTGHRGLRLRTVLTPTITWFVHVDSNVAPPVQIDCP